MGKHKCTAENVGLALKAKRAGSSNQDICRMIGIHEATFYRWLADPKTENQRELCEGLKKIEAEYKANLLKIIYNKAADRDNPTWQAAAWLLERKYPDEYAQRQQVKSEQKVRTEIDVSGESDEELFDEIVRTAERITEAHGG